LRKIAKFRKHAKFDRSLQGFHRFPKRKQSLKYFGGDDGGGGRAPGAREERRGWTFLTRHRSYRKRTNARITANRQGSKPTASEHKLTIAFSSVLRVLRGIGNDFEGMLHVSLSAPRL
jgi:hypothetical protein